jgi:hypothetical protein
MKRALNATAAADAADVADAHVTVARRRGINRYPALYYSNGETLGSRWPFLAFGCLPPV